MSELLWVVVRVRSTPAGNAQNVIDYFTISSYGNASDFGDLTVARGVTDWFSFTNRNILWRDLLTLIQ